MSIATKMATEWLDEVADRSKDDVEPGGYSARRAELLGAGTYLVRQLLNEIADLQAQLDEALAREERRETP